MFFHLCQFRSLKGSVTLFRRTNIFSNYTLFYSTFKPQSFRKYPLPFLKVNKPRIFVHFATKSTKKPTQKELRRLLQVAGPQKWKLTGAVLLLLVSSSVTMAVPFCIGRLIDMMTSAGADVQRSLVTFCKILVAVFVLGAAANFGRVYLMNMSSHQVINSLRRNAYSSILRQESAFFDRTRTGELINRLSADATTVGMAITNNISDGMRYAFTFIGGSCLMVYTSPVLASIGLMAVAPVAIVAAISGKILKRNSKAVQDALAEATEVSEERISNIRTVQAFAKLEEENQIYDSKIRNVLHFASKESLGRAMFFGMTGFSGNLIVLSVLYYGGSMMSEDQITIGGLSAFLLYAAYVGISIGGLSTFYSELMRGLGASTRLWEITDRRPLIPFEGGLTLPHFSGHLSFDHVSFAYPSRSDTSVLEDFNLTIRAGSVVAFVGSSGCGKSTIGSLLLRLYDCQKGCITLDGHDIRTLNLQWLRKNIGIVSQEPVLFSFTIRENILYGAESRDSADEAALQAVLHQANAHAFVSKFPKGLDTVVGERGVMLSGGQRQRIAIARALLKNPKILILDEATSALDAESESSVQRALEQLMAGRTVLTIAHRLSTVRNSDAIVVLEKGRVLEQGSYAQLNSAEGGHFRRMVQLQNLDS